MLICSASGLPRFASFKGACERLPSRVRALAGKRGEAISILGVKNSCSTAVPSETYLEEARLYWCSSLPFRPLPWLMLDECVGVLMMMTLV